MTWHRDTTGQDGQLLRAVGFAGAAVLVLNSVVGASIFVLPATVSARAGAWSPWLFLAVGLLIIPIVLTFAELSSYFKDSGGPVLFATAAFGKIVGFATGWILIISRMTAFAVSTTVMAIYLGEIWPWFSEGLGRSLLIFAVCSTLTLANYVGVRGGVRTMSVLTLLKLTPVMVLIAIGLGRTTRETLVPSGMPGVEDFGGTVLLLIYPFVGFESATIISGETKSPRHTMPRALVRTQIAIGVLYFLIVLAYIAVLPNPGANRASLIEMGRELMGPVGVITITLAAFFSIGGNLSSIMLAVPRMAFALAQEGLLPEWFGRVHKRYSTPGNSILIFGSVGLVFALSGSFVWLVAAASLTRLITYVLCICALPIVRRKATPDERAASYRLKGGYAIPAVALLLSIWIGMQSEWLAWGVTGCLLAVGLALYAWAARHRGRRVRFGDSESN